MTRPAAPPKAPPPERCFYCRDDKISVGVCLDCRLRLDTLRDEVDRLKRDIENWRRSYYRLLNERKREIKQAMGRPKGAK